MTCRSTSHIVAVLSSAVTSEHPVAGIVTLRWSVRATWIVFAPISAKAPVLAPENKNLTQF